MTAIGQQRWDNNNEMAMGGQQHAERMQVLRHPSKQQSNNVTVWGGGDEREGQFGGIEPQKIVKVELIEWRSIDLHSIDFKSTFHLPQSGNHTVPYSACILGVRLHYWRHGKHCF